MHGLELLDGLDETGELMRAECYNTMVEAFVLTILAMTHGLGSLYYREL